MSSPQSDDEIEQMLKEKMIDATYEYFKHIRKTWNRKFQEGIKDKVTDPTHFMYQYMKVDGVPVSETKRNTLTEEQAKEIKSFYRELSLIIHPDKCKDKWAHDIFTLLNTLYNEQNYYHVKEMYDYYQQNQTFLNYNEDSTPNDGTTPPPLSQRTKEQQIKEWKTHMWYLWNKSDMYKKMYITPEELREKVFNMREETTRLEKQVKDVEDQINEIQNEK